MAPKAPQITIVRTIVPRRINMCNKGEVVYVCVGEEQKVRHSYCIKATCESEIFL